MNNPLPGAESPTPNDLPAMTTPDLLELYQQISGRVSMYNTEALIQRMFAIRAELNGRFATLLRELTEARAQLEAERKTTDRLGGDLLAKSAQLLALQADKGRLAEALESAANRFKNAADTLTLYDRAPDADRLKQWADEVRAAITPNTKKE